MSSAKAHIDIVLVAWIVVAAVIIGYAAVWSSYDHAPTSRAHERAACYPYAGRPCILTYTHGTLTGISWYDTQRERDIALSHVAE